MVKAAKTSHDCCGECRFCHADKLIQSLTRCYASPPIYAYGEEDSAVFLRPEVDSKDPACRQFERKAGH